MSGSIFDGIDMSNPCDVYPVLEAALNRLLVGEAVTRARFGDDDVTFGKANISALQARIRELKAQCDAGRGLRRRHAIRAGFIRY
jgi:hypothetical protein